MAKNFSKLKENLPKDVQDRINIEADAEVKRLLGSLTVNELNQSKLKKCTTYIK